MEASEVLVVGRPEPGLRIAPTLEAVFQVSYRRLVVEMYAVVGDLVEAEELVREAFVRAAAAERRLARAGDPEAWIWETAYRLHRSRWRRLWTSGRPVLRLAAEGGPGLAPDTTTGLENAVDLPDVETIVEGAWVRRGRQRFAAGILAAGVAAAGLVGTLGLPSLDDPDLRSTPPASVSTPDAAGTGSGGTPLPHGVRPPGLAAGSYQLPLWRERGTTWQARVRVPRGWAAADGVFRTWRGHPAVEVVVLDVDEVAREACGWQLDELGRVANRPQRLVQALLHLPGHAVVAGPEDVRRFGQDAVHLTLVGQAAAGCPAWRSFELWGGAGNGAQTTPGPGEHLDLWVVDLDGEAALVGALTAEGTPQWLSSQLSRVVDSVRFVS
jgi:hypothetical protein